MKKLYPYIRPFAGFILAGMVLKSLGSVADIALPMLLSNMIDKGVAQGNTTLIVQNSVLMLAISLGSIFATIGAHYFATRSSQQSGQSIREHLYAHLQTLSLEEAEQISAASLTTRVTYDIEHIAQFISSMIRMMMRNAVLAFGGIVMALMTDPYLVATLMCMMLIILCISSLLYKLTRKLYARVQEGLDRSSNIVREALSGIKTIKAFDKLAREAERFFKESSIVRENEVRAGNVSAVLSPTITLVSNMGLIAILWVSGMRVNGGQLEIGKLIAIISYINMIVHSMMAIPRMFMHYSRASASAARIAVLFDIKPVPPVKQIQSAVEDQAAPMVVFEHVSFFYVGNTSPTLSDINFHIKRGETLAVIGETGSGKSTLVHLLAGLYRPKQGRILISGKDQRNFDTGTLNDKMNVAQQQYDIFTASIRQNVILNRPFDAQRFKSAIQKAQLSDFYSTLEQGGDAEIFQAGANLSGGQRQRLNVARVFYGDAEMMVFDDVSSALDYRTNLRLQNELKQLHHKKTILMVAQRISAIQHADRILVLEKGRIAGIGTHEQLLNDCSVYRKILESQKEVVFVGEN